MINFYSRLALRSFGSPIITYNLHLFPKAIRLSCGSGMKTKPCNIKMYELQNMRLKYLIILKYYLIKNEKYKNTLLKKMGCKFELSPRQTIHTVEVL